MRFNEVKVLNGNMALAGPRAACAKADVLPAAIPPDTGVARLHSTRHLRDKQIDSTASLRFSLRYP